MGAHDEKDKFVTEWATKVLGIVRGRNTLSREELEDCVQRASKLRDPVLQGYIANLIGWGDQDRAELIHFCMVALELMKRTRPSVVIETHKTIEIRHRMRQIVKQQENKDDPTR